MVKISADEYFLCVGYYISETMVVTVHQISNDINISNQFRLNRTACKLFKPIGAADLELLPFFKRRRQFRIIKQSSRYQLGFSGMSYVADMTVTLFYVITTDFC